MMFELKNPDWTKENIKECQECGLPKDLCVCAEIKKEELREKNWRIAFNREHQYPYQSRLNPIRREWLNPFYVDVFNWRSFWVRIEIIAIFRRNIRSEREHD